MCAAAVAYQINFTWVIRGRALSMRTIPGYEKGEEPQDVFCVRGMTEMIFSYWIHRSEPIVWYSDDKAGEGDQPSS